jgi:hypothetical protein
VETCFEGGSLNVNVVKLLQSRSEYCLSFLAMNVPFHYVVCLMYSSFCSSGFQYTALEGQEFSELLSS